MAIGFRRVAGMAAAAAALFAGVGFSAPEPAAAAAGDAGACAASNGAEYICGIGAPEDLLHIPKTDWILASGMGAGASHLYVIDSKSHAFKAVYPADGAKQALDKKAYPTCPGPLAGTTFGAHGIDIQPAAGGGHRVYVVNHSGRESIEVFSLDASKGTPSATWIGCIPLPERASGNSVVGLSDGGVIVSNFHDPADKKAFEKMTAMQITGEVLEWHAASGWTKLPGSEMSGANGVAVTPDGKWLYVAEWPGKRVVRFERTGKTWAKRDEAKLTFLTDNLRWSADGKALIAAGQEGSMPAVFQCRAPCYIGSASAKIDPQSLEVTPFVSFPGNAQFEGGTTVLEVGAENWIGSFKGERIARLPAR